MNKKIILFVMALLCHYYSIIAQVEPSDTTTQTYTQQMDSFFSHITWQNVLESNFYDKVYPWANLENYSEAIDTITSDYFLQAFSELERSQWKYSLNDSSFNYKNYQHLVDGSNENLRIPIFSINQNINFIDSNALINGIATDSMGYFEQIEAGNLFSNKTIRITTLGVGTHFYVGKKYQLLLVQPASINNNEKQITKVVITSTSTNKVWIYSATNANELEIEKEGSDIWKIETYCGAVIEFTTTQYIVCKMASNDITDLTNICADYRHVWGIGADPQNPGYQGIGESKKYQGEGEYVIFYGYNSATDHSCTKIINKPLIISDAWDGQDKRRIFSHEILGYEWFDYNSKNENEDIYHKHMTWTENDLQSGTPHNLVEQLRDKGYDVIIVNYNKYETDYVDWMSVNPINPWGPLLNLTQLLGYPQIPTKTIDGGTDFIQRNAQVFQKVLEEVKAITNTEIVIIGPSMGGQITRYALRDYEIRGISHNCRLWVSFDSPHHGANIAYGLQATLRYLGDVQGSEDANKFLQEQMRTPGAREMLISQVPDLGATDFADNMAGNNPLHLAYQAEITSMGMPQLCRKVALINGDNNGGEYHVSGSPMFNFTIWKNSAKHWRLLTNYTNYMNNSYNHITRFYKSLSYKCIGCIYGSFNANGYGSLDGAPGGIYDVQQEFYDGIDNKWIGIHKNGIGNGFASVYNKTNNQCFIPTFSSLAIINKNIDWRTPINFGSLACQQTTPFDNVFIPMDNESHTFLSLKNVEWVIQEIDKGKLGPDCIDFCNALINGSDCGTINTTGNYTYGITIPSNYVNEIIVNTSPNLMIVPNTISGIGFTIQYISTGSAWIEVVLPNPCGANMFYRKEIYIGLPPTLAPVITLTQSTTTCSKWHIDFQFAAPTQGTTYTWGVGKLMPAPTNWVSVGSGSGAGSCSFLATNNQHFTWGVNSNSPCGTSDDGGEYKLVVTTSGCNGAANIQYVGALPKKADDALAEKLNDFLVFPNPTSTYWTIGILNPMLSNLSYTLTDITGKIVDQKLFVNCAMNDFFVGDKSLKSGVYLLNIKTNFGVSIFKLLKE